MLTNKVHNNNPCTEDDLKESIQDVVPSISPAELQFIINNIFVSCDKHLQNDRNHFQHLL